MIAGLLLAAGGATRFGSQKLVAPLHGRPIVRHAAEALRAATDRLLVVTGNDADAVSASLHGVNAAFVHNADWRTGLASSLRRGVSALAPDVEAVVVTLGDQPGIDPRVVSEVIAFWRLGNAPIVAVRYEGVQDHPVLFDRSVFAELLALEGDTGAKPVLRRSPERVAFLDVDAPAPRDVDTPADLDALA